MSKTATSITVQGLDVPFPKYSGVRLANNNDTYSLSLPLVQNYMDQAYGSRTDGNDGGGFVEFQWNIPGSSYIPKHSQFTSWQTSFVFCNPWFQNSTSKDNIFQLVAGYSINDPYATDWTTGISDPATNIAQVFTSNLLHFSASSDAKALADAATHEIGHQFEVGWGANRSNYNPPHVDKSDVSVWNIYQNDYCLMNYPSHARDDIEEFDVDCLYDIRNASDPR